MQIVAYSNFKKNLNSLKLPSGGTTINVVLKTPTSEKTPTFIISGFDLSWSYIQWGTSYYYVEDIVIISNTQAEYHCRKDVLATFRGDILASSQFVTRNANTFQPYLADKYYPLYNKATIEKKGIPTWDDSINTTGVYVVGLVNPKATGGVAYYAMGTSTFSQFMTYMFNDGILNASDVSVEIQKELVNPFQYVTSVQWFPLSIIGDMENLEFGWWMPQVNGNYLSIGRIAENKRVVTLESTSNMPRHPQAATHGIFVNGSPFTRYSLDCWCFGHIPIDPLPFVDNSAVGFRIEVDLFTGAAILTVTNANGGIVTRMSNQFGVPIQISQITQSNVNPIANTVGAAGAYVGGLITGNAVGAVLGAASGIMSAIESAMPQVQTMGAIGSKIAYLTTPSITGEFYTMPDLAPQKVGRPLMAQRTLSSLHGFTICENVDLNTNACPDEKAEIINYMTRGFFIE